MTSQSAGPRPRTALGLLTRTGPGGREVLLGLKRRGFGAGRIVVMGGHLEDGESAVEAAARELAEESGIGVASTDLAQAAELDVRYGGGSPWDQRIPVFLGAFPGGRLRACEEVAPSWFPVAQLPLHRMWGDARHWLPQVLAGERLYVEITYRHADRIQVDAARSSPLTRHHHRGGGPR